MLKCRSGGRWVAVVLALLLAGPVVWMAGCAVDFIGCVDPCGCTLFAEYDGVDEGFIVNVTDDCGLVATLGPFPSLLEAEEAFELF